MRDARPRTAILGVLAATALLAGCGGGTTGVARLGTATAAGSGAATTPTAASGLRYAACMRSHGVAGFPDSAVTVSGGHVELHLPRAIKRAAGVASASRACARRLPGSSGPGAKHADVPAELAFAHCMRGHGIADFPDPLPGGGFAVPGDTDTPRFAAAERACRSTGVHADGP